MKRYHSSPNYERTTLADIVTLVLIVGFPIGFFYYLVAVIGPRL